MLRDLRQDETAIAVVLLVAEYGVDKLRTRRRDGRATKLSKLNNSAISLNPHDPLRTESSGIIWLHFQYDATALGSQRIVWV